MDVPVDTEITIPKTSKTQTYLIVGAVVLLCVIVLILYISQPWRRRPLPAATARKSPMPVPVPIVTSPMQPMPTPPMPTLPTPPMPSLPPMQPSSVGRRPEYDMQPSSVGRRQDYGMQPAGSEKEPESTEEEKHRQELMRGANVGRRAVIAPTTSALIMGAIASREAMDRSSGSSPVLERHMNLLPKSGSTSRVDEPQPYINDSLTSMI